MTKDREFFNEASKYTMKQSYASTISTIYNNCDSIKYNKNNSGRYLTYNGQRYDLSDDPKIACKEMISLLKYLESEECKIPDNWGKIPKFMKVKMIEEYIESAADVLSEKNKLRLLISIKVGIFTNSIKSKDITITDGKIQSIEGVDYQSLDVPLKKPLLRYGDINGTVIYNSKVKKIKYMDNWILSC